MTTCCRRCGKAGALGKKLCYACMTPLERARALARKRRRAWSSPYGAGKPYVHRLRYERSLASPERIAELAALAAQGLPLFG